MLRVEISVFGSQGAGIKQMMYVEYKHQNALSMQWQSNNKRAARSRHPQRMLPAAIEYGVNLSVGNINHIFCH
jgi:hypothetical protein